MYVLVLIKFFHVSSESSGLNICTLNESRRFTGCYPLWILFIDWYWLSEAVWKLPFFWYLYIYELCLSLRFIYLGICWTLLVLHYIGWLTCLYILLRDKILKPKYFNSYRKSLVRGSLPEVIIFHGNVGFNHLGWKRCNIL